MARIFTARWLKKNQAKRRMEAVLSTYTPTVLATGITGGLLLLQLLIVDVAGIFSRHIPGTSVQAEHENFLFRATRAHANTNESVSSFMLLVLFAVVSSASPTWLNNLSVLYVVGRIGHMCFYYANMKLLRSVSFAVSLLALFGILGLGCVAWLK